MRSVRTGKYFKAPGDWTDKVEDARNFKGTYDAIQSKGLTDGEVVEIVFTFGEKKYDVSIRVGAATEPRLSSPQQPSGENISREVKGRRSGRKLPGGFDKGQRTNL